MKIHTKLNRCQLPALYCAGLLIASHANAALTVTVTGDADGSNGTTWVFNGTSEVVVGETVGFTLGAVNIWDHTGGDFSGDFTHDGIYPFGALLANSTSGAVSGSVSGSFEFDGIFVSDGDQVGEDMFGWVIVHEPTHTFVTGETITYTNYTIKTGFFITTFGEDSSAITSNGDTFTVSSSSEVAGDLTLTFSAVPVPEPSSATFLGLGTIGLLARRKRQSCAS